MLYDKFLKYKAEKNTELLKQVKTPEAKNKMHNLSIYKKIITDTPQSFQEYCNMDENKDKPMIFHIYDIQKEISKLKIEVSTEKH